MQPKSVIHVNLIYYINMCIYLYITYSAYLYYRCYTTRVYIYIFNNL